MRLLRHLAALLICAWLLPLSSASPALAAPGKPSTPRSADRSAAQFIRQFPVIRIGITQAKGYGHQAYAATVARRLRELGYRGSIEIFYDPQVAAKLEVVFPGFSSTGPETQELRDRNLKLVAWPKDQASLTAQGKDFVALGLMGGDDLKIAPEQLNVGTLIRIQPSGWAEAGTIAVRGEAPEAARQLAHLQALPTHVKPHDLSDPARFLETEIGRASTHRSKTAGLQALFESLPEIEMLAAYGLGFQEGPTKLANLAAGIDFAVKHGDGALRKPVVIPLLSSFNEAEWETFNSNLGSYRHGRPNVKIVDCRSPDAREIIRNLRPGEILVLSVGPVPQGVWEALVERSTLPVTVAGTSGRNFAIARGKPFLDTVEFAPFLEDLPAGSPEKKVFTAQNLLAWEPRMMGEDGKFLRGIADFISAAKDPRSDVSQSFAKRAQDARKSPDKVSASLQTAARHLQALISKSPSPRPDSCPSQALGKLLTRVR